jgi:hypothetical protein
MPMNQRASLILTAAALLLSACGQADRAESPVAPPAAAPASPAPAAPAAAAATMRKSLPVGTTVYIVEPADGATVTSPVRVVFGLKGAGVAPAGIDLPNTGHHHLLIDTTPANFDQAIPADAQHLHFGMGQTETTVELSPGRHTLQLVLGDQLHVPHDPPAVSDVVTIEVSN